MKVRAKCLWGAVSALSMLFVCSMPVALAANLVNLSGMWTASNGGKDIVVLQTGETVLVHWKQDNPYWNYAAGTVRDNVVKMSFGGSDQQSGNISADYNSITWGNETSWTKIQ